MRHVPASALVAALLASGCTFDEDLPETDLQGTVRLPKDILKFDYQSDPESTDVVTIEDARGIGPVYLGVFPSVREGLYDYPHPELGPVLNSTQEGNTYPYGGTTIGRFDWGCYQELICKVVTGRYQSYDDLLEFFADQLGDPVSDNQGKEVYSAVEFQEQCFEVLYMTGDNEMLFVSLEQDFVDRGDYLEADVEIPHTLFAEGMAVWGWVDMPSKTFDFSTCNDSVGEFQFYYDEQYQLGTNNLDVLNFPGNYIDPGDWVVQDPAIINSRDDNFELEIGFHYVDE